MIIKLVKIFQNNRRRGKARRFPFADVCRRRISVGIAVMNRSGIRVINCLRSLRNQTLPRENIDITVCDLGSDRVTTDELKAVARDAAVRLVLVRTAKPVWSRSYGLNMAFRHSAQGSDVFLSTDIDAVYAPNALEQIMRMHLVCPGATFAFCQPSDLPEGAYNMNIVDAFEHWKAVAVRARDPAVGFCQSFPTEWFCKIRGFDERFIGYGYEDADMEKRAARSGLWFADVTPYTTILHQWHPWVLRNTADMGMTREDSKKHLAENKQLVERECDVIRNTNGWGMVRGETEVCEG